MSGIYIALLFFCVVVIFWGISNFRRKGNHVANQTKEDTGECCGRHDVCEKESLLRSKSEIEYYDDEELDVFAGRSEDSYDKKETDLFCDIFYTLKEHDVTGWLKSLQARNIELPKNLRDEAFLIVRERRGL